MPVSWGDLDRWDPEANHAISRALTRKSATVEEIADGLGRLPMMGTWQGQSGQAASESIMRLAKHMREHRQTALAVASACDSAAGEMGGVLSERNRIRNLADQLGCKIDPVSGAVTITNATTLNGQLNITQLNEKVQTLLAKAETVDLDFAKAIATADSGHGPQPTPQGPNDPSINASGDPNHTHDAGAEVRPQATDINDPGVQWNQSKVNPDWKTSLHNPLMTDNPPGYTGPAGPGRDQAWKTYLGQFPKNQRGFLPNPDAVQDKGLKVVGNAANEMGVSYAWGGHDPSGPSKGSYYYNKDGSIDKTDGSWTYQDPSRRGFDCSGLAQYAAEHAQPGSNIGTWTGAQLAGGKLIPITGTPQPGDFVYYGAGDARHVAIYVAPGVVVEAPESGQVVQLSQRGTDTATTDDSVRFFRLPG